MEIIMQHTFAICAYKESPYLEECIESLMAQEMKSEIIICTSTPNDYIKNIPFNLWVNKLNVSFNMIILVAGVYYIDFVLRDGEEEVYRKINVYSFTLNDKYRGEGFLILGHSWGN